MFPCEFSEIFKNTFFHRTPPVAASEKLKAEAVVRRCSLKKMFLKISQTKGVSCEFCEIFKNTFFHKTPPVAASEKLKTEVVFRRCSVKKVFLEILLNSQENTCARASFLQP